MEVIGRRVWRAIARNGGRQQAVGGAFDGTAAAVEGVEHRRRRVAVAEQLLDGADVVAALQQVRGEAVPERVRTDRLVDAGGTGARMHGLLQDRFVQMVAATHAGARVERQFRGRKYPLPAPLGGGIRVLPGQRIGQRDGAVSRPAIGVVHLADVLQVGGQRGAGRAR